MAIHAVYVVLYKRIVALFFKSLSPVTEVICGSVLMSIGQKYVHKMAIYERRGSKGSTGMCLGDAS